jgi:hypothetical protein
MAIGFAKIGESLTPTREHDDTERSYGLMLRRASFNLGRSLAGDLTWRVGRRLAAGEVHFRVVNRLARFTKTLPEAGSFGSDSDMAFGRLFRVGSIAFLRSMSDGTI